MRIVFLLLASLFTGETVIAQVDPASTPKKVVLAYGEYPPYYGGSLDRKGFITEIVIKAYALSDFHVELVYIPPWQRRVEEVKRGTYDGLYSMWYAKERERWFLFSNPMPANEIGFYKHTDTSIKFDSVTDLAGARLGTVRGFIYPPQLEGSGAIIEEVTYLQQNIAKLIKKRIDMALVDKAVGRHMLVSRYPQHEDDLIYIEPSIATINQHLVISRQTANAQEKLNAFNRGYAILKQSGEVERLATKYGIKPYIVE